MVHQESKKSTTTDVPGEFMPYQNERVIHPVYEKINEVLGEQGKMIVGTLNHINCKA